MQRTMGHRGIQLCNGFHGFPRGGLYQRRYKPLPDIFRGQVVGMHHVFHIEPVVSQIIDHQLIGREVGDMSILLTEQVSGSNQMCLAAVVLDKTIPQVADGAHRKQDAHLGVASGHLVYQVGHVVQDLLDGQQGAREMLCRDFVAIGDDAAVCQLVHIGGTQGQYHPTA